MPEEVFSFFEIQSLTNQKVGTPLWWGPPSGGKGGSFPDGKKKDSWREEKKLPGGKARSFLGKVMKLPCRKEGSSPVEREEAPQWKDSKLPVGEKASH